ncbi:MAG: AAA family ATPase [Desulfobacteraceae bacterium]|jgi:general secretion pathway protein A
MEYYKLLQLDREPFSNSPDPDYFFQSRQHLECLQKLELALRLKRGLNVVIGDVGTGKTTLCRQLIRKFANEDNFESHLILDPSFNTPEEFLTVLYDLFYGHSPNDHPTATELKEAIKQSLFTKGVDEQKTVVLIIDEGQKISVPCVEILRELLNYETNTFKLLQIVIFAQLEFDQILQTHANFTDRINLLHYLAPMNFKDTCQMVQHRLKLSSRAPKPKKLFTLPAMWAIYRASRGYPRKIIHICHQSLLAMIIQNRSKAGWAVIQSCKSRLANARGGRRRYLYAGLAIAVICIIAFGLAPKFIPKNTVAQSLQVFKIEHIEKPTATTVQTLKTEVESAQKSNAVEDKPEPAINSPGMPSSTPSVQPSPAEDKPGEIATDAVILPATSRQPEPSTANTDDSAPPELLGQVVVKPGDTLVNLVYTVYGTYRSKHLRAVIDANPHIVNPNHIDIGNVILFPSLPNRSKIKKRPCFWIIVDEHGSLPSVMQRYVLLKRALPVPFQIIPHWNPESGLHFSLSVKGYFQKEEEARSYIKALPEDILEHSRVVSNWPVQTLFFTNPFEGGVIKSPIIP